MSDDLAFATERSTMSYGNGSIVERKRKRGVYFGIRFMAGGRHRYQSLGADFEGWTRKQAEAELANVIADVRRGRWVDPDTISYVIGQMGHTDPAMTLGIYARAWDRRDGEPERLKALVNGEPWVMPQAPERSAVV